MHVLYEIFKGTTSIYICSVFVETDHFSYEYIMFEIKSNAYRSSS